MKCCKITMPFWLLPTVTMLSFLGAGSAFLPATMTTTRTFSPPLLARRRTSTGIVQEKPTRRMHLLIFAQKSNSNESDEDDAKQNKPKPKKTNKRPPAASGKQPPQQKKRKKLDTDEKKQVIAKAAAELREKGKAPKTDKDEESKKGGGILNTILDPFKAGKKLRETLDTALTTLGTKGLSSERRSIYYLDDRFLEQQGSNTGAPLFTERNPLFDRLVDNQYIPEVLVVGATGEVGRLVVRRLLLDGRFRVRVLVRDLYSKTLNLLGAGVTYCQGDLGNMESLEYAVTDVDKIVFCAAPPRPDEVDFQDRFQEFVKENLLEDKHKHKEGSATVPSSPKQEEATDDKKSDDMEWAQLESVLELRAKLAEQVDLVGMQNLVRAYQNVRVADFGTSQAAKRSLFKFQDRPEDFNLFAIDDEDEEEEEDSGDVNKEAEEEYGTFKSKQTSTVAASASYGEASYNDDDESYEEAGDYEDDYGVYGEWDDDKYDDMADPYADYEEEDSDSEETYATASSSRVGAAVKTQCNWVKNKFDHGVFVGRVPTGSTGGVGGEAAVISSRLRSREDPESGIDLSNGFGGFVCRVCADGGNYEAFVRTGAYETDGVEYVCEFTTSTKPRRRGNKSKNKFVTVRLAFDNFKPVVRRQVSGVVEEPTVPPFRGGDVRQLGFRYRSDSNKDKRSPYDKGQWSNFYLALCYIKVYRSQPEPEFIYLSDARIPPDVNSRMVRHDVHRLVPMSGDDDSSDDDDVYRILDEAELKSITQDRKSRSSEETYYKFRGEEILKNTGLSYAIVRVLGYNESPTGEASSIELQPSNEEGVSLVSRADVAQVCVSALLDPTALNKSFYMTKSKRRRQSMDSEDYSTKFAALPTDTTTSS